MIIRATEGEREEAIEHIVLYDVSWETYERLLEAMGDRRFRHTFDRGVLEIMSPSKRHDRAKSFLGRLIECVALEWDIEIDAIGSTTLRQSQAVQALEPDECYYVAHSQESLLQSSYNFERDPPPDLAVEIDVTHSSLSRLPIYESLGVPEIWRLERGVLTFYQLIPGQGYSPMATSTAFPTLPATVLEDAVNRLGAQSSNAIVREFATWLRDHRPEH